ncbi:MAG: HD domain-containing protein [Phycisphaerae bacterium]|nr:HD domain-containing protein [Phycisphaerae bacterium]
MNLEHITLPVYGKIKIPELIHKILLLPEIQRLRQVSLSNIDSCSLTAIGGVSRYEHSVGTAILAWKLAEKLKLDEQFKSELTLAAGLHDVSAPGLGHLFEEGCKLAGVEFDHEKKLREIVICEEQPYYQAYLGKELGCRKLMNDLNVSSISVFDAIAGQGRCKDAINGSMDLDNIDNVARMLTRLGVIVPAEEVFSFINIFEVSRGTISISLNRRNLFEKWLSLRRNLYNILMPEPTDFVAKSMTKQAVCIGLKSKIISVNDWYLTDQQLFHKLIEAPETADLIKGLLLGQYYRLVGMYWIEGEKEVSALMDNLKRENLQRQANDNIGKGIIIDYIRDKRERYIGKSPPSHKALIGVISKYSSQAKYEQESCDDFMRNNFSIFEKVSPGDNYLHADIIKESSQSLLPFND